MQVTVIGANGFVGSAFARLLKNQPGIKLTEVTRETYAEWRGRESDVLIEAAGNSKKFLADQNPAAEFEASVTHRLRTLLDFPARLHLHISSVDVYNDLTSPATTREDSPVDISRSSRYGAHKFLAEQLVRQYASRWLIVRFAGMVGPGLRKNPVYRHSSRRAAADSSRFALSVPATPMMRRGSRGTWRNPASPVKFSMCVAMD